MNSSMKPRLLVDLVTDIVCPWCYVGLKSWQQTQAKLISDFEIITRFRPYELNQGIPEDGTDRAAHYDRKFPDKSKRNEMMEHITTAAEKLGAPFDPMKPKWLPNTIRAHQVWRWTHFEGLHEAFAENLYTAFWLEDADIGNPETLAEIAQSAGFSATLVSERLASRTDHQTVFQEAEAFRQAGVRGVPTFIINERHGFSGALPPQDLEKNIRAAAAISVS